MFWADEIAQQLKERNLPLEWVDDMKTPSGRIHVGSLRGVVIHDLVAKCLAEKGVNTKSTYVFNDHDPMDGLPVYLPKEFEQYLGLPLFKVPSPEEGYASFAEFFGKEFEKVFKTIGCSQEVVWSSHLYLEGKFNDAIRLALDNADTIKTVYEETYDKKIPGKMYSFQVACEQCGKISTTTVTDWDGKEVTYICGIDKVDFTKGCGYSGKRSPFSSKDNFAGKLPWKIDWPAHWSLLGITVEAAGKDHMTAGGSHDVASKISERVFKYPTPFAFAYEWFILGKKKMSTSKGVGASAIDMLDILPPELLRFVMVRTRINSEINFDLEKPDTIPTLFDEYQRCADAYFEKGDPDFARAFELSQIGEIKRPPSIRFSVLAQWVQMPNMKAKIKEENLSQWVPFVENWLENYAPESEKFFVQENLPDIVFELSEKQKEFLKKVAQKIDTYSGAEQFQHDIYELGKELGLSGKDVFGAIYFSLLGKGHGPKAAWLILSLDKEFVKKRFNDAANQKQEDIVTKEIQILEKPEIFSIDAKVAKKFPSISIGIAIIEGVTLEKENPKLQEEISEFLKTVSSLTTEQISEDPEVISYRKLYKEMGVDWHSRRPSPEALLRRIALGKGLYTINTCVDAYNVVVMKHKVSIGAFDLDTIQFPTVLKFAEKGDTILLLGDTEPTEYSEKEIAYFDQKGGYNMDFNYRDAQRTAVQLSTKSLLINVDGINDIDPLQVERSLQEACDMIIKYCGGKVTLFGVTTASSTKTVSMANLRTSMTRDKAYTLLTKYMQNKNLLKHSLAAEAAMRGIYKHLHQSDYNIQTEEIWGITGLLHDIDYEVAQNENRLDKHGILLFERDPNLIPEPMQHAIKSHNYTKTGVNPESDLDWAITTVDQLTGLVVSSTLVHPDKKLASMTPEFILKKFNTSGFSKGVDRENIKLCESKLGIPLEKFIAITLSAMQGISDELGL